MLVPRGGSPHPPLVIGGSLGMFSALKTVDGFKQRFGRPSPACAWKMCQCQSEHWILHPLVQEEEKRIQECSIWYDKKKKKKSFIVGPCFCVRVSRWSVYKVHYIFNFSTSGSILGSAGWIMYHFCDCVSAHTNTQQCYVSQGIITGFFSAKEVW